MSEKSVPERCGYVALIGRPNVGKSSLLNCLLGQKIAITSRRPQTTRHRILGIKTSAAAQAVYVDTPGVHREQKRALNRYMNRTAKNAVHDVDVIVFVLEALQWGRQEDEILALLKGVSAPVLVALNKVDRVTDKEALLPFIARLARAREFAALVPVSALKGDNVDRLEAEVTARLPPGPPFFPEDQVTDRSERFLAAELVREKLTRRLGQELPYALTVDVEQFKDEGRLVTIAAAIWVERDSQKAIVIGSGGAVLKAVGQAAREEMERLFQRKVFLKLWVGVKKNWPEDQRLLRSLGYTDEG
ncbi:MAG TPA: GTPase Era [Gammaproteobacteria bacterium]|nr:GTPase Era [Gammaproteobacteria bacterium]